jgi:hypothetical protein
VIERAYPKIETLLAIDPLGRETFLSPHKLSTTINYKSSPIRWALPQGLAQDPAPSLSELVFDVSCWQESNVCCASGFTGNRELLTRVTTDKALKMTFPLSTFRLRLISPFSQSLAQTLSYSREF